MKRFTTFKFVAAGLLLATALTLSAGFGSKTVLAASCDDVNIIRCGLDGSNASGYIKSFQDKYNDGKDNGHSDLQKVYNWAGLSDSDVKNMATGNTKVGTIYRNGDIKVGGDVVATDAYVSARFTNGSGFDKISDGVWARKTTTSFQNASQQVIVHYDSNGQMDGAVIIECGNAVKATPKPPKPAPKPVLACTGLKASAVSGKELTYTYTATASASNTKIVSYVFNFGDGKTQTVTTDAKTATSEAHVFPADSKTYSASVAVNGSDQTNVTSDACKTSVTVTKTVEYCKPGIPVGDAKCKDYCKPGIEVGSAECQDTPDEIVTPPTETPAEELPDTGAGAVAGIFAGSSALGTVGYGLIRRKLRRG